MSVRRVSVVGGPGSGKTSVAAALSRSLGVPHVELDSLWWEPSWTPADPVTFERRVRDVIAGDGWVVDGYYLEEAARPLIWPAADTIVWLDLPRRTCINRVLKRTISRVVRRTELWGTNRQSARTLTPSSIVGLVRRWPSYPAGIGRAIDADDLRDLNVVRFRRAADVRRWLEPRR